MKPLSCPACGGPLLKELTLSGTAASSLSFASRCPNCKVPFTLEIRTELIAHIFVNGVRQGSEESTGGDIARLL